jgi:hypothetical protein
MHTEGNLPCWCPSSIRDYRWPEDLSIGFPAVWFTIEFTLHRIAVLP